MIKTWHLTAYREPKCQSAFDDLWPLTLTWGDLNSRILLKGCGAEAESPLQSYRRDLPSSAYQDRTYAVPIICTWTVLFYSWSYRGWGGGHTFCHSPGAAWTWLKADKSFAIESIYLSFWCQGFGGEMTHWVPVWIMHRLVFWLRIRPKWANITQCKN